MNDHLEEWYNLHLWGPILDQCFADINIMEGVRLGIHSYVTLPDIPIS